MPIFTPPTDNEVNLEAFDVDIPWTEEVRLSYRLLRHFQPLARGRNVYKLVSGVFTENEPSDETTILKTFEGGHAHTVTDTEAAELSAAGYSAYISV